VSRSLGAALPPALEQRLSQKDLPRFLGRGLPLVTVDDRGRPHPMFCSYLEVLATSATTVRMTAGAKSLPITSRLLGMRVPDGRWKVTVGTGMATALDQMLGGCLEGRGDMEVDRRTDRPANLVADQRGDRDRPAEGVDEA